jgi:hypothetical protein
MTKLSEMGGLARRRRARPRARRVRDGRGAATRRVDLKCQPRDSDGAHRDHEPGKQRRHRPGGGFVRVRQPAVQGDEARLGGQARDEQAERDEVGRRRTVAERGQHADREQQADGPAPRGLVFGGLPALTVAAHVSVAHAFPHLPR